MLSTSVVTVTIHANNVLIQVTTTMKHKWGHHEKVKNVAKTKH